MLDREIDDVIALAASASEAELRPRVIDLFHKLKSAPTSDRVVRFAGILDAKDRAVGALGAVALGALCENGADAEPIAGLIEAAVRRATQRPEPVTEWCRAGVAVLTRSPRALQTLQSDEGFWKQLEPHADSDEFAWFLMKLQHIVLEDRFVFVEPRAGRAFEVTLGGFADLAQAHLPLLDVLLPYLDPAAERPSAALIATALGEGPQQTEDAFTSPWMFYLHRALQPDGSIMQRGVEWSSPGGTGSGALPQDYQLADVGLVDGVRTLLIDTRPNFRHVLGGSRTFAGLRGHVRLERERTDAAALIARICAANR